MQKRLIQKIFETLGSLAVFAMGLAAVLYGYGVFLLCLMLITMVIVYFLRK